MLAPLRVVPGTLAIVVLLLGVACSSAAPAPSAAPASPAAPQSAAPKPAQSSPAAAKPAESQSAKPAAGADWKAEWDKVLAAAKQEGKVTVAGGPGEMYRKAAMPFQAAYPDIKLEFTGFQAPEFPPRLAAERAGGQFLWDVYLIGWRTPLSLVANKALDPLKSALILPEVLDDSKWHNGLADGWVDSESQYIYQYQGRLTFFGYVNRSVVPESELKTVEELLDPKWKGKAAVLDPRVPGPTSSYFAYLLAIKGEDFVRKLMLHDLVVVQAGREQVEGMIRGTFPIALGMDSTDLVQFREQGLTGKIAPIAGDTTDGSRKTGGYGNATLINKAPHPNAAKVFLNWLLSKEGQTAWTEATDANSRRLDVPGPAATRLNPATKYQANENQSSPLFTAFDRAVQIAREIYK